jgi:hypothetical protein
MFSINQTREKPMERNLNTLINVTGVAMTGYQMQILVNALAIMEIKSESEMLVNTAEQARALRILFHGIASKQGVTV